MDRFTQYAVVAAKMAVEDADLNITDEIAPRVGVWVGSGIGGLETLESQFEIFLTKGPRRVSPFFVPMMIPDMATGQISIALGAKGLTLVPLQHVLQERIQSVTRSKSFSAAMQTLWSQAEQKRR